MNINDINEEWVRENIDIESRRGVVHTLLNSYDINDLFSYEEKEITLEEFIKLLNDKVEDAKERFSHLNGEVSVIIKREYSYDDSELRMIITKTIPEDDTRLIKRLISSERAKIRRKAAKKIKDEYMKEKEIAEYRRLRKKYGKDIK